MTQLLTPPALVGEGPPERPVPYDIPAEEAVLGSLLLDRDAIIKVAPFLQPPDFYREAHGWIYDCILTLYGRREPPDLVTLASELQRRQRLDAVGGRAYLAALMHRVPTAVHVEYYGHLVEQTAVLRRLITAGGQIAGLGYEEGLDLGEVLDRAEALLFGVTARRTETPIQSLKAVLESCFDAMQPPGDGPRPITGVPLGFRDLDVLTGGLQRQDLVIVAARPSVGKSSFALSGAYHAATQHGQRVGIFSLEMSAKQLGQRLLAIDSEVPAQAVRLADLSGTEWQQISDSFGRLSGAPIYFDDSRRLTITDLRSRIRRLQAEVGCDLLIVDYLQLMHGSTRFRRDPNRVQEISEITRGLKELAGELDVPIVALSQLSRAVENRPSKVPMLSDLRDSGSIEQDADIVMFIYRDELYHPETTQRRGIAEIHVAKHRNGPLGVVPLAFHGPTTYFYDLGAPVPTQEAS